MFVQHCIDIRCIPLIGGRALRARIVVYNVYQTLYEFQTSVLNHSTLEFRDFSKRAVGTRQLTLCWIDVFLIADSEFVYKIPYRRARATIWPSASREQRYLAYKFRITPHDVGLKCFPDKL